jgi:hypothetical protein
MSFPYAPSRNFLLQALPPLERDTLLAHLRPTALSAKTVLFEPGEAIEPVHFPLVGVISLVTPLADGTVQVATIGNEGIVGVPHAATAKLWKRRNRRDLRRQSSDQRPWSGEGHERLLESVQAGPKPTDSRGVTP